MLVTHVLLQVLLHLLAARAHRVTCIQHLDDHIAAVEHLVQLVVDALALSRRQEDVLQLRFAALLTERRLVR